MEKESATFESVWAALQEFGAKIEQSRAEADKRRAEADKKLEDLGEYLDQVGKRLDRVGDNINQVNQQLGGIGNSNGDYAEEFFYNALLHGNRNIFGQEFDDVMKSSKVTFNKGFEDEYDILLVNGGAVCIIEVKYKADSSDLPQKMLRKALTFRVNFPKYNDKKVYLALAGMSIHPLTEKACQDNGIAIIKQVGETVAIYDENLKAF